MLVLPCDDLRHDILPCMYDHIRKEIRRHVSISADVVTSQADIYHVRIIELSMSGCQFIFTVDSFRVGDMLKILFPLSNVTCEMMAKIAHRKRWKSMCVYGVTFSQIPIETRRIMTRMIYDDPCVKSVLQVKFRQRLHKKDK